MGIRDWFSKVFRGTPSTTDGEVIATVNRPPSGAVIEPPKPAKDPLAPLKGMPVAQALAQAIASLDASNSGAEAAALLQWIRTTATSSELSGEARVKLSDWLSARGELDLAEKTLGPVVARSDASALPALVRLADLAQQRGDATQQAKLYDEILAIDLGFPGVRERLARMRAPTKAGEAGATLIAPESTMLGDGRFELVSELGRGGAGAVFIAKDTRTRRDVALKLYHPGARGDRNARLLGEAQVASMCSSRHVVRVYDLLEELGALTMERCAGSTLRRVIARDEGSLAQRVQWAYGVAHALTMTHARGWVHRDLKPGNVLQRSDGAAVLTDYGLARRIGAAVEPEEGTAGYTPPEARASRTADPRADVYAFGALLRELIGARDPALAALSAQCLQADPTQRPRDGEALLRALTPMVER